MKITNEKNHKHALGKFFKNKKIDSKKNILEKKSLPYTIFFRYLQPNRRTNGP